VFDSALGARFPNPRIETAFGADTMPQTADNLARDNQISREESDLFALRSQQKFEAARKDGFFQSEIHAVSVPQGRSKPDVQVTEDEHPRPETTMDTLLTGSLNACASVMVQPPLRLPAGNG
jgi:acetyl-CoA C-acetyltransferase